MMSRTQLIDGKLKDSNSILLGDRKGDRNEQEDTLCFMACPLSHDSHACAPAAPTVAPTEGSEANPPQATNTTEAQPTATQAEDMEIIVAPGGEFPVVNQKITLTALILPESNTTDYVNNEYTKWLEEKTNIHLEIILAPQDQTEADQKLNAIFASGDLPDIIIGWRNISLDRQEALAQQGLIVPINDFIDKYGVETHADL